MGIGPFPGHWAGRVHSTREFRPETREGLHAWSREQMESGVRGFQLEYMHTSMTRPDWTVESCWQEAPQPQDQLLHKARQYRDTLEPLPKPTQIMSSPQSEAELHGVHWDVQMFTSLQR